MTRDLPPAGSDARVLLVRTDRLGDVILTLPMLPILRRHFSAGAVTMLLRRYTGAIVEGNPYLDRIVWYDDDRDLVPFGGMLRMLRREAFDAVVVVHPTRRLAWLMRCAGIPIRVGTGYRSYSVLFNRRVFEHRKDAKRHELEYNLNLLGALGCSVPPFPVRPEYGIVIDARSRDEAQKELAMQGISAGDRYAVIHPGSGGSAKDWPPGQFAALAERLHALRGRRVIVTGSSEESGLVGGIVQSSGGKALGVAGRFSVRGLAAVLAGADVVVANSTGPLHLAVAVGTPVVGLYPRERAMSAARWGPYGGTSRVLVPAAEDGEMGSISVESVLDSVQQIART
jgi:heptosyltransferase-3